MDHGPPVNWDDIAGLEFAKTVIKEIVVWPMLRPYVLMQLKYSTANAKAALRRDVHYVIYDVGYYTYSVEITSHLIFFIK